MLSQKCDDHRNVMSFLYSRLRGSRPCRQYYTGWLFHRHQTAYEDLPSIMSFFVNIRLRTFAKPVLFYLSATQT